MHFDIPLCKIDEEKRLVIGQAAAEVLDKSGESMDYASAKAAFQEWSDGFHEMTNGASRGNLRVMHTKEVAGKIIDLTFDDVTKSVNIVAHVASDNAWNLCKSGCYGGFSIGGGYAKRWTEDGTGLKKYTPIVREISLVDNPCIPTARFIELIKADGIVEQLELHLSPRTFAAQWAVRPAAFAEAWAARPRTFGELHKSAGHSLSDAEHKQRIEAAKSRWAKEGGDLAAVETHQKAAVTAASKSWFGAGSKVKKLRDSYNETWSDMAASHEAYDKLRPHLPEGDKGKLMIMGEHSIYDPEGVSDGVDSGAIDLEHTAVYGVQHHEVGDMLALWKAPASATGLTKFGWSEDKHPRGKGGEFVMESAEPEQDKAAESTMGGFAAGYGMGGIRHPRAQIAEAAANAKVSVERTVKFGLGEKGLRNQTASMLRGAPGIREVLKSRAHNARIRALEGHTGPGSALAEAGRRKIMEEAATRGSSQKEARIAGDKFAEKIRARAGGGPTVGEVYRQGVPTRRVSPAASAGATRAAQRTMKAGVSQVKASVAEARRQGVGSKMPPLSLGRSLGRRFAFALPMSVVGNVLGQQSATRDKMELNHEPVSTVRDVAATTGDVFRSLGGAPAAGATGAYLGGIGSMAVQGLLSRAGGKPLNPLRAIDHMVIGSRVGQALAIGTGLHTLYHEMSARYGGAKPGGSPDKDT